MRSQLVTRMAGVTAAFCGVLFGAWTLANVAVGVGLAFMPSASWGLIGYDSLRSGELVLLAGCMAWLAASVLLGAIVGVILYRTWLAGPH